MEWAEFYELEPWGFAVEDMRMAMVCSSIFRAQGGKVKPQDFMRQEDDELPAKQFAEALKAALGAEEVARDG